MVGTWRQLDALARTTLPRIGVLRRIAGSSPAEQGAALGGRSRPSGPSTARRCTTTTSAPSALRRMHPVLGVHPPPHGHRPRLRPRHAGLRHGRRRGRGQPRLGGGNGGYGHMVLLNHEFGYKTRYAHLSEVLVQPGERVARGQVIARNGQHGASPRAPTSTTR